MKKKIFALSLALILALSLAACGGKDSGGSAPADTQTPADSAPEDSAPAGSAETVKLSVAASPTPRSEEHTSELQSQR